MSGPSTNRAAAYPTWLPMPACAVHVVVGPPGPGLVEYARAHAAPGAQIIDIDAIIARLSGGAPGQWIYPALDERNRTLAALATAPADHECWMTSPSPRQWQRDWWQRHLGARIHLADPGIDAALTAAGNAGLPLRLVHGWYHEAAQPDGWKIPPVRDTRERHLAGGPSGPRPNAAERGYGDRQGKMRATQLAKVPWCERCEAEGRGRVRATDLNHRVPFKRPDGTIDGKLFGDPKNHESLCRTCHAAHGAKTTRDASPLGSNIEGKPLNPAHPWNRR